MHHLAVVAVVPGSELAGGLMDVVLQDCRREERVQKAFSVDHHGPGNARLSHRALKVTLASEKTKQCLRNSGRRR